MAALDFAGIRSVINLCMYLAAGTTCHHQLTCSPSRAYLDFMEKIHMGRPAHAAIKIRCMQLNIEHFELADEKSQLDSST